MMIVRKTQIEHIPVMVEEVLQGLNLKPDGIYVDGTFGRGGHSEAILQKLGQNGRLIAFDKDPDAAKVALVLSKRDPRFSFYSGSFEQLLSFCKEQNLSKKIDGILLDLGVSSPQLNEAKRGFSFQSDGPLDMRMDTSKGSSAAEWINSVEESELAEVLKIYGEERFYKRIAHAIILARSFEPITTTQQLATVIVKANPAWEKRKHPATRSFQAIRIFINRELEELSACLEQALEVLAVEGRLVVISFHSLEDRLVKRFIQKHERGVSLLPAKFPVAPKEFNSLLRRVGRKQLPSSKEISKNVRSRSAILRVAERVSN